MEVYIAPTISKFLCPACPFPKALLMNTGMIPPTFTKGRKSVVLLNFLETDTTFHSFGIVLVLREGLGREEGVLHVPPNVLSYY